MPRSTFSTACSPVKATFFSWLLLGLILFVFHSAPASAAETTGPGRVDQAYPAKGEGPGGPVYDLRTAQNGLRRLAGAFSSWGARSNLIGLVDLDLDGSVRTAYTSPNPLVRSEGRVLAVAPAGWNRFWIGGDITSLGTRNLGGYACLETGQGLVDEVRTDALLDGSVVHTILALSDGCLLGGTISNRTAGLMGVVRLNSQGILVPDFKVGLGGAEEVRVRCLLQYGSDGFLVGGLFESLNGVAVTNLAYLRWDGTLAPSPVNSLAPDGEVLGLAVDVLGRVYVGGSFGEVAGATESGPLFRLLPSGQRDRGFVLGAGEAGFQFDGQINAILPIGTGKVILGGDFEAGDESNRRQNVARFDASGRLDLEFGSAEAEAGPDGEVRSLAVEHDGSILIGGEFRKVDGVDRPFLARLTRDANQAPSVRIITPTAYALLSSESPSEVQVEASDPEGAVDSVEVWDLVRERRLITFSARPYVGSIPPLTTTILLQARVYDRLGAMSVSETVPLGPTVLGGLTVSARDPRTIELTLQGAPDWSYELQVRDDLNQGGWRALERVDFDPLWPRRWTFPVINSVRQYYRAVVSP